MSNYVEHIHAGMQERAVQELAQGGDFFGSEIEDHQSILYKRDFWVGVPLSYANLICTMAAAASLTISTVISGRPAALSASAVACASSGSEASRSCCRLALSIALISVLMVETKLRPKVTASVMTSPYQSARYRVVPLSSIATHLVGLPA